jgi:hypothetical protein
VLAAAAAAAGGFVDGGTALVDYPDMTQATHHFGADLGLDTGNQTPLKQVGYFVLPAAVPVAAAAAVVEVAFAVASSFASLP